MRKILKILLTMGFFTVLGYVWSSDLVAKQSRPPTKAEIADVWVGLSEDDVYYYRCKLSEDGRGLFVSVFLNEKTYALRIQEWKYKNRKIEITLTSDAQKLSGVESIIGEVTTSRMVLKISGNNWSKTATLRKEGELEVRAKLAKEATEAKGAP